METSIDDVLREIFLALEGALASVFHSIDINDELDGALVSLENMVQKLYRLKSLIPVTMKTIIQLYVRLEK